MNVVSIDVGFGMVKAYTKRSTGASASLLFPAAVADGQGRSGVLGDGVSSSTSPVFSKIAVNGTWFYVGDRVELEARGTETQTHNARRVFEPAYTTLISAALLGLDIDDSEDVVLALGLPLRDLHLRQQVKAHFEHTSLDVQSADMHRHYRIGQVGVTGQGIAALYDTIDAHELSQGTFGVVEIGAKTTDYSLLQRLTFSETATYSINIAMSNVLDQFLRHIERIGQERGLTDFQIHPRRVERHIIDHASHKQGLTIRIGKDTVDLEASFQDIVRAVANNIVDKVTKDMGNLYDLDGLVVAGGGALVMFEVMQRRLHDQVRVLLSNDPQFANAKGAYQMMLDMLEGESH